jgi:hypothetical protein
VTRPSSASALAVRTSVQMSRCAPMSTRSRLLVAQIKTGMPIRSAYQRFGLFAAFVIELEISPSSPKDSAAPSGDSDAASAAKPSPATATSASGSSQMNSR